MEKERQGAMEILEKQLALTEHLQDKAFWRGDVSDFLYLAREINRLEQVLKVAK